MPAIASLRPGILLIGCAFLALAQDSAAPPDKGSISGKVLNSVTGEPVRKAEVSLFDLNPERDQRRPSPGGGAVITDAAGHFEFKPLPPGNYGLVASRDGFASPNARGRPKMQRIVLARDEEHNDAVIHLQPLGAIAGRVLDDDGDPLRNIDVQLLHYEYTASGRRLESRAGASTNDLGEYRIYDLEADKYFIRATPQMMGGRGRLAFAISYYPGTPDPAAATPIDLAAGEQLHGMDLTLHQGHVASIRGRILNPGSDMSVGISSFTSNGSSNTNTSVEDKDGKFELTGINPGPYVLTAQATTAGVTYVAHLPVQVSTADLEGIELRLLPPMEIHGQIRIEGKSATQLSHLNVTLDAEGRLMDLQSEPAKEDGSFVIREVQPELYRVSLGVPDDLYLKSVHWGDRDVAQSGLEVSQGAADSQLAIVLSANGGRIEGTVEDDDSKPVAGAMVALVPPGTPPPKALFKWGAADLSGHFAFIGIAPGSYKLYALEDADPNQLMYDPDFLKPLDSQAESVDITEGSRKTVELKLIKPPAAQ
jgi:protocatechuate 3,4-dioxygenase beta subunit